MATTSSSVEQNDAPSADLDARITCREALKALIPQAFDSDGGFSMEAIRLAIGEEPRWQEKRFGLFWPGKEAALKATAAPLPFSLGPDLAASVDFHATRNVFIEADNLAALRLTQNAYAGQVKLIYVDPPYNTGNDFVYKDNFADPLQAYLAQTGQLDADGRRVEAGAAGDGGRRHGRWFDFMYPRLQLAQRLLREDGAIMVACDDNEMAHLRLIMNEIFGEENFVGTMVWQGVRNNNSDFLSSAHDYMICFAKNVSHLRSNGQRWMIRKDGLDRVKSVAADCVKKHAPDWEAATAAMRNWFRASGKDLDPSVRMYDHIDGNADRGHLYQPGDLGDPGAGGRAYDVLHPITRKPVSVPKRGWMLTPDSMKRLLAEERIHFYADETRTPRIKRYLQDTESMTMSTVFEQSRQAATQRLSAMMGGILFDYPKDETVIARFIEATTDDGDIVMDFFGGSGTTGHAVWLQNAKDGKNRRFVLATLPEPVAKGSVAEKAGYAKISDITIERLRRSAEKVKADNPAWTGDAGFRVFRLGEEKLAWRNNIRSEADLLSMLDEIIADKESDKADTHLVWREALKAGYRLDATITEPLAGIHLVEQVDRQTWIAFLRDREIPANAPMKIGGPLRLKLLTAGAKFGDDVIVIERNIDANDTINVSSHFQTTLVGLRSAQ